MKTKPKVPIIPLELQNIYLEDAVIGLYKNALQKEGIAWAPEKEQCIPIGRVGPSLVFGHYLREKLFKSDWPHVFFQHVIIPEKQYHSIVSTLNSLLGNAFSEQNPKDWENSEIHTKEDFLAFILKAGFIEDSLRPFLNTFKNRSNWRLADLPAGYPQYFCYLRDRIPIVPLESAEISSACFDIVEKSLQERHRALCFAKEGSTLYVAVANPKDYVFEDLVIARSQGTINKLVLCACDAEAIAEKRQDCLKRKKKASIALPEDVQRNQGEGAKGTLELDTKLLESLDIKKGAFPAETLFQWILYEAMNREATDIHIEQCHDRGRIRFRVDGDLFVFFEPTYETVRALVTVCKNICSMSSNLFDNQDAAFSVKYEGQKIHLRVNAIPFRKNFQKLALRILPRKNSLISLDKLGIAKDHLGLLRRAITRKQGLILITGPTGEGKTTTLYACLSEINKPNINIQTIEDPIEREIEGINQTAVNLPQKITFAKIMRSIVRQDPNVILLGEIRDPESAELAIEAALTGHLVFSTIHANSAIKAIQRLTQLRVPHTLLADSLIMIQAQRLIKRLCNRCKKPQQLTLKEKPQGLPDSIYTPQGCSHCDNTGYSGRLAIMEMIPVEKKMAELILRQSSFLEIQDYTMKKGLRNLYQDALFKCSEGLTSLEQAQIFEEVWA